MLEVAKKPEIACLCDDRPGSLEKRRHVVVGVSLCPIRRFRAISFVHRSAVRRWSIPVRALDTPLLDGVVQRTESPRVYRSLSAVEPQI